MSVSAIQVVGSEECGAAVSRESSLAAEDDMDLYLVLQVIKRIRLRT